MTEVTPGAPQAAVTAWSRSAQDERLALTLTASGLKVAFLNQLAEVPALRSQFQGYLGLGTALPQLLLRFGYADPLPHSLRRPLEEVIVENELP